MTLKKCGRQTIEKKILRQKKKGSTGTLYCTKNSIFWKTSHADLSFHFTKKCSSTKSMIVHKYRQCSNVFPSFYSLKLHKQKAHWSKIGSEPKSIVFKFVPGNVNDQSLHEEMESCKHFFLDSDMKKGPHSVRYFVIVSFTPVVAW